MLDEMKRFQLCDICKLQSRINYSEAGKDRPDKTVSWFRNELCITTGYDLWTS
jgi:hypothetical protein